MKKQKTVYVCGDCGADHAKWQGQCQSCGEWNTLSQLSVAAGASAVTQRGGYSGQLAPLQTLGSVPTMDNERWRTESVELNRVLGGGLVPGSAILMGGAPGAGKSTLLLQVVSGLAERKRCLYITGEESLAQVALRAKRLKLPVDAVSVAAQTSLEAVFEYWDDYKPDVLVVDSIQVMHSESLETLPGSVSQVREVAARLVQRAKQLGTVLILVGHVTKEGNIAGPRVLEHMIDTFLMLGGEDHGRFRMLRSVKNRFGAVNELGIFAMMETGMLDVENPSAIFLSRGEASAPGSQVMAIWEGTRPLLVEAQALVDESMQSNPRRIAVGFESQRLAMLLAVLHRHGGLQLGDQDVYLNAVGGVRVEETSSDLAVLLAVISSARNRTLPSDLICFGEIGLSGEVRPVSYGPERLREAVKHGFKRALVPKANLPKEQIGDMSVHPVQHLSDAMKLIQDWM